MQGLILRFHAVARSLGPGAPARDALDAVLERADDVMVEARDRVLDLRATARGGCLAAMFARMAAELEAGPELSIRVSEEGNRMPIDPIVQDELLQIGREAMLNACRHAGARHIGIAIEQNAAYPLQVADLAQIAGLSCARLHSRFASECGQTPMDYIRQRRLRSALTLLRQSSLPIGEVANRVGYSSQSAFAAAMLREFGASPSVLRREPGDN